MSLNNRRDIFGPVIHPRIAASDRKQRRRTTPHSRPPAAPQDIIEISSDEDENVHPPSKRPPTNRSVSSSTSKPDYHSLLAQKDEVIDKLKRREKELERVVEMQRGEIEAKEFRQGPKLDEIEEELTCEVCAMRMWAPYLLTECGHAFCLDCLLNWFDDVHARFLNTHPGYAPLPPQLKTVLRRPLDFPLESGRAFAYISQFPGPQFTCPSCRAAVTRRPIEDFKLKALASWLGSVQGVEPPKPTTRPGKGNTVFDGYSLL